MQNRQRTQKKNDEVIGTQETNERNAADDDEPTKKKLFVSNKSKNVIDTNKLWRINTQQMQTNTAHQTARAEKKNLKSNRTERKKIMLYMTIHRVLPSYWAYN